MVGSSVTFRCCGFVLSCYFALSFSHSVLMYGKMSVHMSESPFHGGCDLVNLKRQAMMRKAA